MRQRSCSNQACDILNKVSKKDKQKMKTNIGEAILILGCLFFIVNYPLKWWVNLGMLVLIGFALATWEFVHHPKELKDLTMANLENVRVRTELMKAQIKFYVAQTFYYMKGRKPHGD
jgi:hypothetical protein